MNLKKVLLAAVIGPLATVACHGAAFAASDVLVVAKAEDPPTADPAVEVSNNGYTLIFPSYERLVKYDGGTTNVVGEIAKSWTVDASDKVWTFKLNPGHSFNDGSPVDAAAIKFTFDRLKKIGEGPNDNFPTVDQVIVIDPTTVEFHLSAPFAPFLSTLATSGASIVNPKVVEHEKDGDSAKAWLAEHTAGSGPYEIANWERNQEIDLDLNPHYGGSKPALSKVVFKIVREVSSRRLQLENGDVDLIDQVPADQAETLKANKAIDVQSNPSLGVIYLYLNNKKAPLDDVKVRQALSYAVDYKGIISGILQGQAEQMQGAVPDGMWAHDPSGPQFSYDPEKAKKLLDESGQKNLHLTYTYSQADASWEPVGLALQAYFAAIGVTLDLKNMADPTKRELVAKGDFDIATGAWTPDYADPYMFMNLWYDPTKMGAPGNRAFYDNPEVTKLINEAGSIVDQKKREQLYIDAQKTATMDAPYIMLFQKNDIFAMRSIVKGFVYNPMLIQVYNFGEMSKGG